MTNDFGAMTLQERHERLWEELSEARRIIARLTEERERARAERDQYLVDFTAELNGGMELRKYLGAQSGETIWSAAERAVSERDRARAEAAQYRRCVEAVAHFWRNDPLAFGDEATPGTLAVRFAALGELCCDALEAHP